MTTEGERNVDDYKSLIVEYQNQIHDLRKELDDSKSGSLRSIPESESSYMSIEGVDVMLLRIGSDESIQYVNRSFCERFGVSKEDILNEPSSILKKIMDAALFKVIQKPEDETLTSTVRDEKGVVYSVKATYKDKCLDIVYQDVSDEFKFKQYVSKYVSSDLDQLSDEDLVTFKYPERRNMTVSFTDIRGFTSMSESLSPEEVRTTMNAYLEEIIHAIDENHGTVDKIVGDEVMALYGAPRYYEDHALRAIKTCCDQMFNLRALQKMYARAGKIMPDCGIGINTGEMVIGNMGSSSRQDYTALGAAVNLGARLCAVAKGSEVIISESTLYSALEVLPVDWEVEELKEMNKTDSEIVDAKVEGLFDLPDHLKSKIIKIGPMQESGQMNIQFAFQYLYAAKVKGVREPFPVISVLDHRKGRGELVLDETKTVAQDGERIFGKYRLFELIGKGGMGEVYRARDAFGNHLAIKTLIAGESASGDQLKRFQREAEIMAKLDHRFICRIIEVGEFDGITYIAMEYIDGVSLSEILKSQGHKMDLNEDFHSDSHISDIINHIKKNDSTHTGIDENEDGGSSDSPRNRRTRILPQGISISLILDICEAVSYAHSHGILHRDLKPANIMLRKDGHPVLMDFGLAKLDVSETHGEHSMSLSGQIMGTIEYMSPEQAQSSKDVDGRADVYSIGAVLYQTLTGNRHFESSANLISDANRLQDYTSKRPSLFNKSIEQDLELITLKALRCEKEERYQTAKELQQDIQRYHLGEVIHAKDVTLWEVFSKLVKRNRLVSGVVAASITLIFSIFVYTFYSINKEKDIAQTALQKFEREEKMKLAAELAQLEMEKEKTDSWLPVMYHDFASRSKIPEGLELKGEVEIKDGAVELGYYSNMNSIAWSLPVDSEFKLELEISCEQFMGLAINIDDDMSQNHRRFVFDERISVLSTFPSHVEFYKNAIFEPHIYRNNKSNRLTIWRDGHAYFIKMNESETIHISDHLSLPLGRKSTISIARWLPENFLKIHSIRIERKQPAEYMSVLEPGRVLKYKGLEEDAILYLKRLVESTGSKAVAEEASFLSAMMKGRKSDWEQLQGLELIAENPENRYRYDAMHEIVILAAQKKDWQMVVKYLFDVSRNKPELMTQDRAWRFIKNKMKGMPKTEYEGFLKKCMDLPSGYLDLSGMSLENLNILKNFTGYELDLGGNPLTDLEVLRDLPIRGLSISGTRVRELESLKNMPIEKLWMKNLEVSDLSAISGKSLRRFFMKASRVPIDMSSLKGLKASTFVLDSSKILNSDDIRVVESDVYRFYGCNLTNLNFMRGKKFLLLKASQNQISDIDGLRGCRAKDILIDHNQIKDLTPLKDCEIWGELGLKGNPVADITALKGSKLKVLNLSNTEVEDISVISTLNLERLNLSNTKVKDISALKGLKLKVLNLSNTDVNDISALAGMNLDQLNLSKTKVKNVSSLRKSKVKDLDLSQTNVEDISSLGSLGLEILNLSHTKVKVISSLSDCNKLKSLFLNNTEVRDISVLANVGKLESLSLHGTRIDDISFLNQCGSLFSLDVSATDLVDMSEIAKLNLSHLDLGDTQVENFRFLEKMKKLKKLDLGGCKISDLYPIRNLDLNFLILERSLIRDISYLKNMNHLGVLSLKNTKVKDISALRGMSFRWLILSNTKIKDFTVLKTMLRISNLRFANMEITPQIKKVFAESMIERIITEP